MLLSKLTETHKTMRKTFDVLQITDYTNGSYVTLENGVP